MTAIPSGPPDSARDADRVRPLRVRARCRRECRADCRPAGRPCPSSSGSSAGSAAVTSASTSWTRVPAALRAAYRSAAGESSTAMTVASGAVPGQRHRKRRRCRCTGRRSPNHADWQRRSCPPLQHRLRLRAWDELTRARRSIQRAERRQAGQVLQGCAGRGPAPVRGSASEIVGGVQPVPAGRAPRRRRGRPAVRRPPGRCRCPRRRDLAAERISSWSRIVRPAGARTACPLRPASSSASRSPSSTWSRLCALKLMRWSAIRFSGKLYVRIRSLRSTVRIWLAGRPTRRPGPDPQPAPAARGQHLHRTGLVLQLGPFVLTGHHHSGRQMGDAHRAVGGVHTLAAFARGPVDVDAQIGLVDLNPRPLRAPDRPARRRPRCAPGPGIR